MITAEEYMQKKSELMKEYEDAVRLWLGKREVDPEVVRTIPFFADGVVCREKWFSSDNRFRPLFIMKEASIGFDGKTELAEYYEKWKETYFDHAEDDFGDIKIGINRFRAPNPWMKIVKLSIGLKHAYETSEICKYEDLPDISFKDGGVENPNAVDPLYAKRTGNKKYIETVDGIAVINIKKLGGGTNVNSELSRLTGYYLDHLESPLDKLMLKQIHLIDPSIIVFCSPEISWKMRMVFGSKLLDQYICLDGYHPTQNSTDNFYYKPIKKFLELKH